MNSARGLAVSLRVMNTFDAFLTIYTVTILGAEEANPAIGWLLRFSPILFVVLKIVGVAVSSEFLARRNQWHVLFILNVFYVIALAAHARCL